MKASMYSKRYELGSLLFLHAHLHHIESRPGAGEESHHFVLDAPRDIFLHSTDSPIETEMT